MYISKNICYIITSILLFLPPALANEPVGKITIRDRNIILHNDHTWHFEITQSPHNDCLLLSFDTSFCPATTPYEIVQPYLHPILAQIQMERYYALIFELKQGYTTGITLDSLKELFFTFMENNGIARQDILTISMNRKKVFNKNSVLLVLKAKANDSNYVFAITFFIEKNASHQIITVSTGTQFTDEIRQDHENFLKLVEIKFD